MMMMMISSLLAPAFRLGGGSKMSRVVVTTSNNRWILGGSSPVSHRRTFHQTTVQQQPPQPQVPSKKKVTTTTTTTTTTKSFSRSASSSSKETATELVDLREITDLSGVRLTDAEFARLTQKIGSNTTSTTIANNTIMTRSEWRRATLSALEYRSGRELCLSVLEQPTSWWDKLVGQHALRVCDVAGTLLYAVAGTQVAGDFGMNIVGCTLVGCATALGGGTLNNVLHGASSPLHSNPGVFWVKNPSYLAMAAGASIVTFFAWPYYTQAQADHYLKHVVGEKNLNHDGSIGRRAFVRACQQDVEFLNTMRAAVAQGKEGQEEMMTPKQVFDVLDENHNGNLDRKELRKLTQTQFDNSTETYVIDTLALASFAVAAAHGSINAGVHPLVACTAGVTICFGGIVRDVLCGRPIAIGAQSYAFATGAGASVYVALRELCVRGVTTSLFTRIVLASGTTIGLRYWEHEQGRPLLAPMHGRDT